MNKLLKSPLNRGYFGFTLAEMMVVMLILSIIMAAMAPVMTTRNKLDQSSPWQWATNGSDAYFGIGSSQTAMIGQQEVDANDEASRLIINAPEGRNHILFKQSNTTLGRLFMDGSILLGTLTNGTTLGSNAVAIGPRLGNTGTNSVAIGTTGVSASGNSAIAIGDGPHAENSNDIVIGYHSSSSGVNNGGNIVIGHELSTSTTGAILIGGNTALAADAVNAIGIGNPARADQNSIAIGNSTVASSDTNTSSSVAIGTFAVARANDSIAIGHNSTVNSDAVNSISIGNVSNYIENSVAIGSGITIMGVEGEDNTSGLVIGTASTSAGTDTIVMGHSNASLGDNTIAIGHSVSVVAEGGIALGRNITISEDAIDSIAIGRGRTMTASNSIAISTGTHTTTMNTGEYGIAMGHTVSSGTRSVAIGYLINQGGNTNIDSVAIGNNIASVSNKAIAIGTHAIANKDSSIAIGNQAQATENSYNSIAIGTGSIAQGSAAIAIGSDAQITTGNNQGGIAIGMGSRAVSNQAIAIGVGAIAANTNNIAVGNNACKNVMGTNKVCIGNNSGPRVGESLSVSTDSSEVIFLGNSNSTVYVMGNLRVGGNIISKTDIPSDRRLKYVGSENTSGLDKIKQLKVFNYTFKKDEKKTPHVGVIAQDLQKIFPDAVKKGIDGFLTIRMEDMFYAMINAIKELDTRITALEKENQQLKEQSNDLKEILKQVQNDDQALKVILKQVQNDNKELKSLLKQSQEDNKKLETRLKALEAKVK